MHRICFVLILLIGVSGLLLGQSNTVSNSAGTDAAVVKEQPKTEVLPPTQSASSKDSTPGIKIGSGDLIEVKVFGLPEMTSETRVSGEGNITVALVGSVPVAGMTAPQAERSIEKKLVEAGMLRDPHVTIFVKEYVTQGVSVMGEVQKPGIYPLLGTRRLFDALSAAGGTTAKAGKLVSVTRRNDPDHPVLVTISNDPLKAAAANVEIQPGDTVVVTKAGVVYVVGDVVRPGGFIMDNNESLRVLQALALAQGFNHTASLNNAKLIRKTETGLQEIPVPLKKIMENKAPDMDMQGEDILFVPASATKGAARRTMEAAIQAATGVAIYRR